VLDRAVVAAIVLVGLYSLGMVSRGIEYFLAQGADDAAYYLKIAENVAAGRGFTFDGLAPTNGFHPLWAWLLVGLHRASALAPEDMVRLVWVVQSLLMTFAAFLCWRLLRRHAGSWPAAMAAVLFTGRLYYTGRGGMESSLLLVLMLVLLDLADRRPAAGTRSALAVGAIAGLVMLTRLDSLFAVGAVVTAWSLGAATPRARLTNLAIAAGVAAIELSPYLFANLRDFGHAVPISGTLKSSFPHAGWYVSRFNVKGQDLMVLAASVATSVAYLFGWAVSRRKERPAFLRTLLPAFAAGLLVHVLYSSVFMKWGVFSWHFVLERLGLSLMMPVLVGAVVSRIRSAERVLWPALLLLLTAASVLPIARRDWRTDYSHGWTVQAYRAARWARLHTPADAVFAMKDAGNFGYFSRRRVMNLDGLVNTFAFQDSLAAGRFEGFLRSRGVQYLVQHAIYDRPDIVDGSYASWRYDSWSALHDRPGGSLTLRAVDEVYRSEPFTDAGHPSVFLVWRMPPP